MEVEKKKSRGIMNFSEKLGELDCGLEKSREQSKQRFPFLVSKN